MYPYLIFFQGYNRPREYIASQGPLPVTVTDMWRMVWEHDVPTVVMLTNLVEKMKIKCSQYWPDSGTATYGDYVVTLTNTITLSDFVIRCLSVKNVSFLFKVIVSGRWIDFDISTLSPVYLISLRILFSRSLSLMNISEQLCFLNYDLKF